MELEFTADQEELRESVRAVLARECPITLVREVVEKGVSTDGLWRQLGQLDWPALTVPQDHGGMGFGMVELAVLMEETGGAVTPGPLFPTLALFVPAVREAGSSEQRDRFLRPVAERATTGTLAVAEERGSWDPSAVFAGAVRRDGLWQLSGTKRYVVEADRVDEVVVAARLEGTSEVGLFVVPAPDLEPAPIRTMDGSRRLCTVPLDGVVVAEDRLLRAASGDVLRRVLDEATTALSLELVGTCAAIFTIALEYAKTREQFGVKIGSFQAMKHKLADMYVALEAARAAAYFAAAAVSEDDSRRSLAASMAKALAGDCERRIAQEGIQSLGGIGYTWEHDMHLYVKRAMGSAALLGTAEEHRRRVASLLGLSTQGGADGDR
ncbi:MAG TPA: acyl-CoA dehydrogenase family protein [Acidimicrobiales bacterium]|nr:acyl-CoA dehydrogenase family protein [Acidimicrobiales bacterium]